MSPRPFVAATLGAAVALTAVAPAPPSEPVAAPAVSPRVALTAFDFADNLATLWKGVQGSTLTSATIADWYGKVLLNSWQSNPQYILLAPLHLVDLALVTESGRNQGLPSDANIENAVTTIAENLNKEGGTVAAASILGDQDVRRAARANNLRNVEVLSAGGVKLVDAVTKADPLATLNALNTMGDQLREQLIFSLDESRDETMMTPGSLANASDKRLTRLQTAVDSEVGKTRLAINSTLDKVTGNNKASTALNSVRSSVDKAVGAANKAAKDARNEVRKTVRKALGSGE